jgi:hypothetical protein
MSTLRTACSHHGPVERVPRYVTFGMRLQRRLQRSSDAFRAIHQRETYNLLVPAKGDGYTFRATVHFTWCVTGRAYPESLAARIHQHGSVQRDRLITQVRQISRTFAAYEVGEAEQRIHETIGEIFTATRLEFLSDGQPDGEASPIEHQTILHMEKPVQNEQREAWTERQKAVNKDELARLLVTQFSGRRLLWQQFLRSGEREWLTPYAVALAENPNEVAGVVERMSRDRRAELQELADQIVDQVHQYEARDAFDLMMQNDRVLRHLLKLIGVPDPPPLAPSPFDEPA